jgi:hypothetical protein
LSKFHASSGVHAAAPNAIAIHTRGSRSACRPAGNSSSAIMPTPITAAKR